MCAKRAIEYFASDEKSLYNGVENPFSKQTLHLFIFNLIRTNQNGKVVKL